MVRIGVVGDYKPDRESHLATTDGIHHAADRLEVGVEVGWISTSEAASRASSLDGLDGLLIAPGSPYRSMDGALAAIRAARTQDVPMLATCGGFQHVVLEYARNVLHVSDAGHAEYDPYGSDLFITPLCCSLAGRQMAVQIVPGTRAAAAYSCSRVTERYYCDFGLNPDRLGMLVSGGLVVSGIDHRDEVRILELEDLRLFVATLFVPQISTGPGRPHPLLFALVAAAAAA